MLYCIARMIIKHETDLHISHSLIVMF